MSLEERVERLEKQIAILKESYRRVLTRFSEIFDEEDEP